MGDRAELELVISSQVDRVLAGISSFERSLERVEKAHGTTTIAAEKHAGAVTQLEGRIGSLAGSIGRLANIGTGFAIFEALKGSLAAFDGLEQHNIDLLRTTEILGGNAKAASTWSVVAHELNISLTTIDRAFTKLSTDLNSTGNPALKQMGINASDAHGKLRPLNDVINQAADYFHAHAGAVNNAALANALFGRSGYELLPILQQGRAGLQAITEEAAKYGLILDATTIQRNAAFTFQLKEAQLALDGMGMAIGNAVLPAVAALGKGFAKLVQDNLPAFTAAITRAVSYLVGFVSELTGMDMVVGKGPALLSDFTSAVGDSGSAMGKAGSGAQALSDAIQKVRDHTTAATRAIDEQIKSLNAQQAAESFMDRQAKLQQDLANKAHDIDKLRHDQYVQFWLGNFSTAADIGDQITKAQQDQANIQLQMTRGTEDAQTKAKVDALQRQKQSIEDAANKHIEAMQRAARGTTDAIAGAAASFAPAFSKGSKKGIDEASLIIDQGIGDIGRKQAANLMDAMFGPLGDIGGEGHHEFVRSGGQGFVKIGEAIGESISHGITAAVGSGLSKWWSDYLTWLKEGGGPGHAIPATPMPKLNLDRGGIVPGRIGAPQLAIVHGGEEVRTPAQQRKQATTDMHETNQLLRQLIGAVVDGNASSSAAPGGLAAVNTLIDVAKRSRGRGMVGVFP